MSKILERELLPVNHIVYSSTPLGFPPFSTTNQNKIEEIKTIIPTANFIKLDREVDEIQSTDPLEVAKAKAESAFYIAGNIPVIIEDTSVYISALSELMPPTYVKNWAGTRALREKVCELLKNFKDRSAIAKVILCVFDGKQFYYFEGITNGTIAEHPMGPDNFGWDDIFIPDGDKQKRTFSLMTKEEKNKFSMRKKALTELTKKPLDLNHYILATEAPNKVESARVNWIELNKYKEAKKFALSLRAITGKDVDEINYVPIKSESVLDQQGNEVYVKYNFDTKNPDLGLILTYLDLERIETDGQNRPVFSQIDPERRKIAIAQRIDYFLENHNPKIYEVIKKIESKNYQRTRANRKYRVMNSLLELNENEEILKTSGFDEIGYRKNSSANDVSRKPYNNDFLLHKVGKYARKIIALGSMPQVTGGRDAIVTAAIGHMLSFIPRNNEFADNVERQIELFLDAKKTIYSLDLKPEWKERALRNIGVSLGIRDPKAVIEDAKKLYKIGVRVFRIYTIAATRKVIETAKLLRQEFGDEIEIMVGKVADKKEALELISDEIRVDMIDFGHGGGRQCMSATNGMNVTTNEENYEFITDPRFNNTTLINEGGLGRNLGVYIAMGVDCVLYNQRLVRGTLENPAGDLFVKEKSTGKLVQPYPGEASIATMIIEATKSKKLHDQYFHLDGRAINTEGKPGFSLFEKKAGGSAVFWIDGLLNDVAKMLADFGLKSINELREFMQDESNDPFRVTSQNAQEIGGSYRNNR